MARKKKHPEHVNHERWLISYADFITLLFAFFVVMFAVSQVDSKKVGRFQDSFSFAVGLSEDNEKGYLPRKESLSAPISASMMPLREIFEDLDEPNAESVTVDGSTKRRRRANFPKELAELEKVLENKKVIENTLSGVKVVRRGSELVLRLDATALFDSGTDKVKAEALPALDILAEQVRDHAVQIRVEGHTDDIPIKTARFRSNWDLSTARATSVVSALAGRAKIDPSRIAAIGYAEFQPIAPNDGPDNRAKNRRVDFVLSVFQPLAAEDPSPTTEHAASPDSTAASEPARDAAPPPVAVPVPETSHGPAH